MCVNIKTAEEFEASIGTGKVLVDFWATWCGPCLMMGRRIAEELELAMPDLKIVKVNVDEAPELAARFGIMSIPTLICFRDGTKRGEFVGVTDCVELRRALED